MNAIRHTFNHLMDIPQKKKVDRYTLSIQDQGNV